MFTKRCSLCGHTCDDCGVLKAVEVPGVKTKKDLARTEKKRRNHENDDEEKPQRQPAARAKPISRPSAPRPQYDDDSEFDSADDEEEYVPRAKMAKRLKPAGRGRGV